MLNQIRRCANALQFELHQFNQAVTAFCPFGRTKRNEQPLPETSNSEYPSIPSASCPSPSSSSDPSPSSASQTPQQSRSGRTIRVPERYRDWFMICILQIILYVFVYLSTVLLKCYVQYMLCVISKTGHMCYSIRIKWSDQVNNHISIVEKQVLHGMSVLFFYWKGDVMYASDNKCNCRFGNSNPVHSMYLFLFVIKLLPISPSCLWSSIYNTARVN